MKGTRVLIVDDDDDLRGLFASHLTNAGHAVAEAGDAREARSELASGRFDVVLCDIAMPGESGLSLCRELLSAAVRPAVIVVTALQSPSLARTAADIGAHGYLTKPEGREELLAVVAEAAA